MPTDDPTPGLNRDSWVPRPCRDPSHKFPNMWCPKPGTYTHVCPSCGNRQVMVVHQGPTLEGGSR